MGALVDLWYLHRESILRIAGICLLIAAGVLAVGRAEAGMVLLRDLAVPLIAVATVTYVVRRWYWYDEDAGWRELSPGSLAAAGVLSVVLVLIGGGPGGPGDRALIETAITRSFMESDPALCDDVYTQAFVDQTHLGAGVVAKADCRQDEADPNPPGTDPDGISIDDLVIAGPRARATVKVLGGALDQTILRVQVASEDGTWKVDRLVDVELDRAAIDRAMFARMRDEGLSEDEASCAVDDYARQFKLGELERAIVTGAITPDPEFGVACFATSTLRAKLVAGVREVVRERGFPDIVARCLAEDLRELPEGQLRAAYRDGDASKALMVRMMGICLAAARSSSAA